MRVLALLPALVSVMAQTNVATIVHSGSTNQAGFHIAVDPAGKAEYAAMPRGGTAAAPRHASRDIPEDVKQRLFADLQAAMPFSSLPAPHCMKPASFRYRLTIEYDGQTTPDLSCGDGGNEHLRALIADVKALTGLFQ